jgi:hypothetical protein
MGRKAWPSLVLPGVVGALWLVPDLCPVTGGQGVARQELAQLETQDNSRLREENDVAERDQPEFHLESGRGSDL